MTRSRFVRGGWLAVLTCLSCAAWSASADAQAASERERGAFYGWQNLTLDASAFVLAGTAATVDDPPPVLVLAAAGVYALGSATVHWVHGNVELGFGALGLRAAVLVTAFLAAYAGFGCLDDLDAGDRCDGPRNRGVALAALTGVAAIVIDLVGGYDRQEGSSRSRLQPIVALDDQRGWVGLRGAF